VSAKQIFAHVLILFTTGAMTSTFEISYVKINPFLSPAQDSSWYWK